MIIPAARSKVRASLKLSILDGSAWGAMTGLTQNYLTPLALALKATTAQIGLLTSLPNLSIALSQLAAPRFSEIAGSRKRFLLPMVFVHALTWLPVALLPFIFHSYQVWWLIILVTAGSIFGSIANPAWGSWMADLVPIRFRGRYFGLRTGIIGIVTLVFSFAAAGILELFSGNLGVGFGIIFGGATLCRLLSFYFLTKIYEPPLAINENEGPSLLKMLRGIASTNLGKFTLYVSLMNFATNLAAPFFAVYMLQDLQFSYMSYTINVSFFFIALLASQTFWGRRADWAGNIKVITIISCLLPFIPILWLGSTNIYYLMAAQIFSGFLWGGFNLVSANFIYDVSETQSRTKCIALFNVVTGIALCLGALAGGYLIPYLPRIQGNQILTLFLLSGLLRIVIVITLLRFIAEVRPVPRVHSLRVLLGRPGTSAKTEKR